MTLAVAKSCGPGRPKDLEKRAAILAAAKRLFPLSGFEGTSMDAIAAEAGVSKLTVYSHFTDKETLFVAAIRARCTGSGARCALRCGHDRSGARPARGDRARIPRSHHESRSDLAASPADRERQRIAQARAALLGSRSAAHAREFRAVPAAGSRSRPARRAGHDRAPHRSSSRCSRARCTRGSCAAARRR